MDALSTTAAVQQHLDALADTPGESPAEPIVRALLTRAVDRLHGQCASLLHRSYPRLTRGPVNLQSEELLSAVAERLLRALRQVRPRTVRQFFALAGQHMRWELNDVARRFEMMATAELPAALAWEPQSAGEAPEDGLDIRRFLEAIEALPDEEREAFDLVRVQGLTQAEAAGVAGCVERTIQRRLNRSLVLLTARLGDFRRSPRPTDESDE